MRYMVMHKTSAKWENGAKPTGEVIAQVGAMIGEMVQAGVMRGGDGLGPSAQGVRIQVGADGQHTVTPGPFDGVDAVPARYLMFHAETVDQAASHAARFGKLFGAVTVDVRPANEPWDLGFAPRPEGLKTRRYMAVVNESKNLGAPAKGAVEALTKELGDAFIGVESFEPSAKGKRLKAGKVLDGPFSETKELIGGFVLLEVPAIEDAVPWAQKYIAVVETDEVDVRGLS